VCTGLHLDFDPLLRLVGKCHAHAVTFTLTFDPLSCARSAYACSGLHLDFGPFSGGLVGACACSDLHLDFDPSLGWSEGVMRVYGPSR
jgi:hypothetical protein